MDWLWTHIMLLITQYPEVLAMAGGILVPMLFTEGFKRAWLTQVGELEKVRIISTIDFLVSFLFTDFLWRGLDAHESQLVRVIASLGIAMSCFMLHLGIITAVRRKLPWLDVDAPSAPPAPPSSKL